MATAIPIILMAVSTAATVYGTVQAGKARANAAKYNAAVAQQNAQAQREQADARAQAIHRDQVQKIGAMQAAYGAAGVSSTSGSALDVLGDSIRQGTLDQLTAKYNGQLRAAGYQDDATLDNMRASSATTSAYMQAAGEGLAGAGKVYQQGHDSGLWGSGSGNGF